MDDYQWPGNSKKKYQEISEGDILKLILGEPDQWPEKGGELLYAIVYFYEDDIFNFSYSSRDLSPAGKNSVPI